MIDAVLFDFGGVIAEEGFKRGLEYIASVSELNPDEFFEIARELVYSSGFVTGACNEQAYWEQLRARTGIQGSDQDLRQSILDRFIIRNWMLDIVRGLKHLSVRVAILSDQTNWLDELDRQHHFSELFEHVFNSYHIGKSKADESLFEDILHVMGLSPGRTLFIDDGKGNITRAQTVGLQTIYYSGKQQFFKELQRYCPGISCL
jgi:putative hydrolase of the HAD superfamily